MMQNNNLKKYLGNFMGNYLEVKTRRFSSNEFSNIVTKQIPNFFSSLDFIENDVYKIEGSCGKGNWANVPWIAIMDKNITTSTQICL